MEFVLLLVIAVLTAVSAQTKPYLITVPSVVHVGVEETVTVQLHQATTPATITLYFKHLSTVLSDRQTVTLNADNDYQAVVKLKVKPDLYEAIKGAPYVSLMADGTVFAEKRNTATCRLSNRKGYIFIQTDKPIYNPGEAVNFRIFTLDNYMRPTDESITINIFNSDGLKVYKATVFSQKIFGKHIAIPSVERAGHWRIVAEFMNMPMSNTSVEFEVREYVLPSFEVKIEPAKKYHLLKDESFQFSVSARYTYGKGVNGVVYARFGIIDEQGNKTFLPGLEKQTSIQDGKAELALLTKDLLEKARTLDTDVENRHIYIAVTALESASGELEETESSSVKIVNSPYKIDLAKTKTYFTPEGEFSILASATYPDGTPAQGLRMKATVKVTGETASTIQVPGRSENNDGEVALTFTVPRGAKSLEIKVFAEGEDRDVVLSDAHMTAVATSSDSKRYLSVEVPHLVLEKGQEIKVTFRDITPPGLPRPTHIYYMIFSKGRAVMMGKVERSEVTSVSLPFSYNLVPAFRVVAYYFPSSSEFVADSVWVDVQDVCEGQVRIQPFEKEYTPGTSVDVVIHTDKAEKVALGAVDTAVYILNKRNKLTARKVFDQMNSYDLACTNGGGKDHLSVLIDAGLTFISSFAEGPTTLGLGCHSQRQKRAAAQYSQAFSAIVGHYSQGEKRKCCNDGARLNTRLSCEQRHAKTQHRPSVCRDVFLKCCREAKALREKIRQDQKRQSVARTQSENDVDALNEAYIHLRSFFPQSWMWQIRDVGASGIVRHDAKLPDSITTWEIQAIGISQKNGFCVAEPQPLKVFQEFFVSLKLPYSVKRNEQLEVKAVVYNYGKNTAQVTVKMDPAEGLCTAGSEKDTQSVSVPGNSAVPVYFTVIPLKVALIPITVTAFASYDKADKIKKILRVEDAGELVSLHKEYSIEARGPNVLEIEIEEPDDAVPGSDSQALISVRGGIMGESAENCLTLEGVSQLIKLPGGCAEQTMSGMSPAIHAMKYLDATDQWQYLSPHRRREAEDMIQKGYAWLLQYMKPDGAYGSFRSSPYSIGLTAFVAKELTRARTIIQVDDSYIQRSIKYVVSQQRSDGSFADPNPFSSSYLLGAFGGAEGDVALTAYVLVALSQSLPAHGSGGTLTRLAIMNAQQFLESKLDSLTRPYSKVMTAYALSLADPRSAAAIRAKAKLKEIAKFDNVKGTLHWQNDETLRPVGQASSTSVEMTSYALLTALASEDMQQAKKIAKWLTEERQYGGGFRSTQDTVVALEALAELSGKVNDVQGLDLSLELCHSKSKKDLLHLTKRNAMTQPSIQVTPGNKVSVDIWGKGDGTLSLLQTYKSMKLAKLYCDYYHLNITLEGEVAYEQRTDDEPDLDDYYNYEQEVVKEEPMDKVEWFDLRTRRRRHAPAEPKKEETLVYNVCVRSGGGKATGMAIVDISLISGLEPNIQDLEDQVKGTEKYIDHYDLGKNKVFLYFDRITESEDCVSFRAKQITPVGLAQPAGAVIYDYYNPERRCSVFYSAPQKSTMLSKLCSGDVCECAEGHCPKTRITFSKNMEESTRKNYACFYPSVDYAYVVNVLKSTADGVFRYYTVEVTSVLQIGKDRTMRAKQVRELIQRMSCTEFEMITERNYLVMGKDSTVTQTSDANGKFRYLLTNEVWVEEIPAESKCKATKNRKLCHLLASFIERYQLQKCAI